MTIQDIILNLALCDETGDVPDYVDLVGALHSIKEEIKQLQSENERLKAENENLLNNAQGRVWYT